MKAIRSERTLEQFSRGAELIQSIIAMWDANRRLPAGANDVIDKRIGDILGEYDLTLAEWHYWCSHAAGLPA